MTYNGWYAIKPNQTKLNQTKIRIHIRDISDIYFWLLDIHILMKVYYN